MFIGQIFIGTTGCGAAHVTLLPQTGMRGLGTTATQAARTSGPVALTS